MGKFILGFIVAILLVAAAVYASIALGWVPATQDAKPSRIETWAAQTSLRATINRETKGLTTSMPPDEQNLTAGAKLYDQYCDGCHGGPDAAPSPVAKGLQPDPPQLAKDGVEDDPEGVTYWKIEHGIRFTGMPSFAGTLTQPQMWQLALFLKHMDKLPPPARAAWASAK